jgi:hypothetical protein
MNMSAFLGPIHHWLFNKIRIHEDLEAKLIKLYKTKYGNEVEEAVKTSIIRYGEPLGSKPLEDQIDLSNIHQWLNKTIGRTETRLAYILGEVFRKHGQEAVDIALEEYKNQGEECGADARAKGMTSAAPQIYKAINDYMLEGMPCDRVNFVTSNSDDLVQWKTTDCLHRGYWKEAGADINTLYNLRFEWIKSFVKGSNPAFEFSYYAGDNIDSIFIQEIRKSS